MIKWILFLIVSIAINYYTQAYIVDNLKLVDLEISYEKGFKRGVECRELMSAPLCKSILEEESKENLEYFFTHITQFKNEMDDLKQKIK